ncbi:HNH endonuclease signature motif containing protein [Clostridium sp. JNZ J1-5]
MRFNGGKLPDFEIKLDDETTMSTKTYTYQIIEPQKSQGTIYLGPLGSKGAADATKIANKPGKVYPKIIDPRTGKNISFPEGNLQKVPKDQRIEWNNKARGDYIKEWYDRGYKTPDGGWEKYDLHHIKPREYDGDNSFGNLVPVERTLHKNEFNPFWLGY